jgi:hypothetical protein
MTDKALYKLCKKYGRRALEARRKFTGLLPEVNKRRLYERRGFESIYVFAAKLAGVSREQVDAVLRLEKRFEDKPVLRAALVEGKLSVNKLIRVASIATAGNQGELFEVAQKLSKTAIEVFVKDYKNAQRYNAEIASRNCLFEPENTPKSLPGQEQNDYKSRATLSAQESNGRENSGALFEESNEKIITNQPSQNFDFEIIAALSPELKQKIKELMAKGIDVNGLILNFLEDREQKIRQEKEKIAAEQITIKAEKDLIGMPTSRHIPSKILRIIHQEHGSVCEHNGCEKPAKHVHHEHPFAVSQIHDPRYLKPLCKGHHELVHAEDMGAHLFRRKIISRPFI